MSDRIWEYTKEPPTTMIEVETLDEGEALSNWVDDQVRRALKEFMRDSLQVRRWGDRLQVTLYDGGYEPIITMEADWARFIKTQSVDFDNGEPDYPDDEVEE